MKMATEILTICEAVSYDSLSHVAWTFLFQCYIRVMLIFKRLKAGLEVMTSNNFQALSNPLSILFIYFVVCVVVNYLLYIHLHILFHIEILFS